MKKIAVIGLGILGRNLAQYLMDQGVEVIAIDSDMALVEEMKDRVTYAVCLDVTNQKALEALDIVDVDSAVVCIGEHFQSNLLATVILKKIGVKYVITRASNPLERMILEEVGVNELIYPEENMAKDLSVRLAADTLLDHILISKTMGAAKIKAPKIFWGKTLAELELRKKYGINVVAIYKSEKYEETEDPFPSPEQVIQDGQILLIVGHTDNIMALSRMV